MRADPNREKTLAEQALQLSPDAQTDFLKQACEGDDGLRQRVENLLRAAAASEEALPPEEITLEDETPITEGEGSVIGRYKLLQQIGEGGFGVVYMADQTEPVTRRVPQDAAKAYMWLNLAVAGGAVEPAFKARAAVRETFTPEQLANAYKLRREWLKSFEAQKGDPHDP